MIHKPQAITYYFYNILLWLILSSGADVPYVLNVAPIPNENLLQYTNVYYSIL